MARGQAKEFGTFPGLVAFSVAVAAFQHPVAGTWLAAPVRLDSESKVPNKRSHDDFGQLIDAPGSVYMVAIKCEERTSWLFCRVEKPMLWEQKITVIRKNVMH